MSTNPERPRVSDALHHVGAVRAVDGDAHHVVLDTGDELVARRARSCLAAPEPGDLVLLVASARGAWVLAVLDRETESPLRLDSDGDVTLRAGGRLTLSGRDGVTLSSPRSIHGAAPEVSLHASEARVVAGTVALCGASLDARFARACAVLDDARLTAERVVTRARWSARQIDETDHLRAGRIDHAARGTLCVRAESAVMHARCLVKIDGAQIQLG